MRYVAFLRAINVGGHTVRMEALRALFKSMGAENAQTFIASGNVIFDVRAGTPARLERKLERGLADGLGYPVATFLRTLPELQKIAVFPAFPQVEIDAAAGFYVGFLRTPPAKDVCEAVAAASTSSHRFQVHDRELYWLRVNREEEFAGPKTEKAVGPTTVRSITTVRRIVTKYGGG
jgi:uncharacterized protein (DUF1697 family)